MYPIRDVSSTPAPSIVARRAASLQESWAALLLWALGLANRNLSSQQQKWLIFGNFMKNTILSIFDMICEIFNFIIQTEISELLAVNFTDFGTYTRVSRALPTET